MVRKMQHSQIFVADEPGCATARRKARLRGPGQGCTSQRGVKTFSGKAYTGKVPHMTYLEVPEIA
eukprot:1152662-Pelagomonas_calceolata.AAC.5